MSKKEKNEPKPDVDGNLRATRLAALLDFYSDRATAHASLFVASIFGLFSVLSIVQQLTDYYVWYSMLIYFVLAYSGYFTLVRFGFYATIAQNITTGLEHEDSLESIKLLVDEEKTDLKNYMSKMEKQQQKILFPKKIFKIYPKTQKPLLIVSFWIIIGLTGIIGYSNFLNSLENWKQWFYIFIGLFLILVILSPLIQQFYSRISNEKNKKTER